MEGRRDAVERDAGRAGQIRPEDSDGRSNNAEGRQRFQERRKAHAQFEDGAATALAVGAAPPFAGCSVEVSVGALNKPTGGGSAIRADEGVQGSDCAGCVRFEDGAAAKDAVIIAATLLGRPVEIAIVSLQ